MIISAFLAFDFPYQLTEVCIGNVADFGLVINGYQRDGDIIPDLLHVIGNYTCTAIRIR